MAGTDVQALFLQVDASVELLRRSLASGEQPMSQFEGRAKKMAATVDASIATMGGKFGAFATMAESAAQKAERSFNDSFSQIQQMAAKAITTPTVKDGGLNIGAADARSAAAAAQQQALALGLIERAAIRAATGSEVLTKDTAQLTQETRIYLQAAGAARIEAERHAAELTREAGALERLEIELRQAGAGQQLLAGQQRAGAVVSGQQRTSTMMLGQQVQDFAVQVSAGGSAVTAFSQQIGQAAFAVQNMGGKMAGVAAFLGSGWGAAVTVALVVLAPLVAKILEGNNALEDAVKKLKKDAEEAEVNRQAKDRWKVSEEGLIAAVRERLAALDDSIEADKSQAERDRLLAEGTIRKTLATRKDTQALLEHAIAQDEANRTRAQAPGQRGEVATLGLEQSSDRVAGLRQKLVDNQKKIDDANKLLNQSLIGFAVEDAARAVDPVKQINKIYDDQRKLALSAADAKVKAGEKITAALTRELIAIEKNRAAALKAQQEAKSAASGNRQIGRDISVDDARNIVSGIGGRVTSGQRSREKQAELYARYKAGTGPLAAAPGTSMHEAGDAVDIAKTAGMSLAKIRKAFADQGVRLTELLDEGSHFHAGWGKKGPSAETMVKREEAARVKALDDDTAYNEQERQVRHKLLEATRKTAGTEEQRDALLREDINAEADAMKKKIANQLDAKDITPAQALHLNEVNEATRKQKLQNVAIDRATTVIENQFQAASEDRQTQIARLQIQSDMATTLSERRRIALEILELEQQERRAALERVRATSNDPAAVQRATDALKGLPATDAAERAHVNQQNAGPLGQYKQQLHGATDDMNTALEGVAVDGLQSLQDGLLGIIDGTKSVGEAFKQMADQIIADLIRIAIQKFIVQLISGLAGGGPVDGAADGGPQGFANGGLPRFDGGGRIRGAGTGRSDSILALLGGKKLLRVSNGEYIVNAAATREHFALIEAINSGKMPKFADGGMTGAPSLPMPRLRMPSLPSMSGSGNRQVAVSMPISINAPGADAATLGRVERQLQQLQATLPAQIVSTVYDARQRGMPV